MAHHEPDSIMVSAAAKAVHKALRWIDVHRGRFFVMKRAQPRKLTALALEVNVAAYNLDDVDLAEQPLDVDRLSHGAPRPCPAAV